MKRVFKYGKYYSVIARLEPTAYILPRRVAELQTHYATIFDGRGFEPGLAKTLSEQGASSVVLFSSVNQPCR